MTQSRRALAIPIAAALWVLGSCAVDADTHEGHDQRVFPVVAGEDVANAKEIWRPPPGARCGLVVGGIELVQHPRVVWQGSNYLGRLSPIAGCSGCPTGADGYCIPLYGALAGWRNNIQVMRFMWDLIDTSTGGGWDSVDYTAGSLVTAMQSMPTGFGVDGSCRESERPPGQSCNPAVNGDPVSGGTGSRDAYNPRDISDLLPEDLTTVMDINCVSFATDN